MNYKGVIFDLDGTILDSLKVWQEIDEKFFRNRTIEMPKDFVKNINGMKFEDIAKYTKNVCMLDESIEDLMEEWRTLAYNEYAKNIKLKSGVKEYLIYLKEKGIKMGIATACDEKLYTACLKNNKIFNYFDTIVNTSDVEKGKEFSDIYKLCADKLGLKYKDVLVFEDIITAIRGAKSAGMKVYAVYDKNSVEAFKDIILESDDYISDFRELIKGVPNCH